MRNNKETMIQIAHIESPYGSKFGVPRQAGLAAVPCRVVFEEEYRVMEAVRGLEEFDYVWLLWGFHLAAREGWSPTVRPPRLGGNKRVGVFATRSPFRPNNIGLSAVRLLAVEQEKGLGPVLTVDGADMVNGTPIYDIKPYIEYADSHPGVRCGFASEAPAERLEVRFADGVLRASGAAFRQALAAALENDPRPRYQHDDGRRYVMEFAGREVEFTVAGTVLTVQAVRQ